MPVTIIPAIIQQAVATDKLPICPKHFNIINTLTGRQMMLVIVAGMYILKMHVCKI